MTRATPASRPFFPWIALVVCGTIAFASCDTIVRSRHLLELSAREGIATATPAVQPTSATGFEGGERSLVLPNADTAHWVMQSQLMAANGDWRIRAVDYDNRPEGREVHWAAPLHWWLLSCAWIDRLVSGHPIGLAIERATLTSGLAMFVLLSPGLAWLLNRKFSPAAAIIATLGLVAVSPFYDDFLPGRADHHGLANLCCLGTVLFLAIGSMADASAPPLKKTPSGRGAAENKNRLTTGKWSVASGVAGGIGLWISAATVVPVLVGIGLGILGAGWLGRKTAGKIPWLNHPELLRAWAWTGSGVSLLAYLIEYFPSHLGLRLEVNHPLYALAWFGAGELLRAVALALEHERPLSRRDQTTGMIGLVLVLWLPATIAIKGAASFTVADPFVWQLHAVYISEFQGLRRVLAANHSVAGFLEITLPVLLVVPPLWLMLRSSTSQTLRGPLVLTVIPTLLAWIMAWNQVRWVGLAFTLSIAAIAVFFRSLEPGQVERPRSLRAWLTIYMILLLPGLISAVRGALAASEFTSDEIHVLAQREVAQWLRNRAGDQPVIVATTPSPTTQLIYFGGLTGLGTLYWENAAGLKKAAALFSAPSPEAARALVQRLGITHIALFSWDAFEVMQAKLYRGLPVSAPIPPDLFIVQLLTARTPPPWLRALPFHLPKHPALAGDQVRLWEVVPEQSPIQATVKATNYYLELGQIEAAKPLEPRLRESSDFTAAIMLAGLLARVDNESGFTTAFDQVLRRLPEATSLSFEDHVHLVVVLTVGQRLELARAQLVSCVAKISAENLRALTPGTLSDLVALSAALDVELPAAFRPLAQQLLPPAKRK